MSMHSYQPELKATPPRPPEQTEHHCDVLVVGGGFAGLMAAITAKTADNTVILVDKGLPGFSGLTPFASDVRWFDPDMGDDAAVMEEYHLRASQYMANMNWFRTWLDESKCVLETYRELGLCERTPSAKETGHSDRDDYAGYCKFLGGKDRHKRFVPALKERGITVVPHTMMCRVLTGNGRAVGAVGFHVPSGTPVVVHAKATVLCMGGGVYKNAGWPTGGVSYDALAMAYRLGLPIIGQEFEDFHRSRPDAPSNAMRTQGYSHLQNLIFFGGEVTRSDICTATAARGGLNVDKLNAAVAGQERWDDQKPDFLPAMRIENPHPGEIRCTPLPPQPKRVSGTAYGAAPGFCMHTTSGIYCGNEDTCGFTGIEGLYCAGDGCNGGPVGGSAYAGRMGFTSNFAGVQGKRAGQAALAYSSNVSLGRADEESVEQAKKELLLPLAREKGFDPGWALDCLQGIMAPMWTLVLKNEERLNAALTQVRFLREHVVPRLLAVDGHGLRLCTEVENKTLEAEMKLRLSLARKESRGGHYREDYPCRDDENFLCYLTIRQGEDGSMIIERVDYPDAWKGNKDETYAKRYGPRWFPGEAEAAKAKGLLSDAEPQASAAGKWGM